MTAKSKIAVADKVIRNDDKVTLYGVTMFTHITTQHTRNKYPKIEVDLKQNTITVKQLCHGQETMGRRKFDSLWLGKGNTLMGLIRDG